MADPDGAPDRDEGDGPHSETWAETWAETARRRRAVLELGLRAAGLVAVGVLALALAAIARILLG